MNFDFENLKNKAIRILSFREHSVRELALKLKKLGASADLIAEVVRVLQDQNYLSDRRYAECYIRSKSRKGYGPYYCQRFLEQAGISSEIILEAMNELKDQIDWENIHQSVASKKSKLLDLNSVNEKIKLQRFLKNRGF